VTGSADISFASSFAEDAPLFTIELDCPVEWQRYCFVCDSEQRFVADRECLYGLVGCCSKCKAKRIAPFTRMNSEVG